MPTYSYEFQCMAAVQMLLTVVKHAKAHAAQNNDFNLHHLELKHT